MTPTTAVIKSDQGKAYTLVITPETLFVNTSAKSRRKKPKVTDRVLVDVHEMGSELLAVKIDFQSSKSR